MDELFEYYDDPVEIDKRCKAGPVLCMLLNQHISFDRFHWLVHNRYVFELGDETEPKRAVALGFYKEPAPDTLEPENEKKWGGSEDEHVMEELIVIDGAPYVTLNEKLLTQQIDNLRCIGRIVKRWHKDKLRFCIACAYYYETETMKKSHILQQGD